MALINGLRLVLQRLQRTSPRRVRLMVLGDSELVVKQMTGVWRVADPTLKLLHAVARGLAGRFGEVVFRHLPRANPLAAAGTARKPLLLEKAVFYANRVNTVGVEVDGLTVRATHDKGGAQGHGQSMVDAEWLGTSCMGRLEDPAPISTVVPLGITPGGPMAVLGALPSLSWTVQVPSRRKVRMVVRNVLVVLGLPVPMHLALGRDQTLAAQLPDSGAVLDFTSFGQTEVVPENFPMEFRGRDFWKEFDMDPPMHDDSEDEDEDFGAEEFGQQVHYVGYLQVVREPEIPSVMLRGVRVREEGVPNPQNSSWYPRGYPQDRNDRRL
ncbi:hypothetical protein HDU96_007811 [Phlyctochytrium bullatum]|nr:hypothetical protein HDU96_007811 [Phlyctochytrium bullatum]